MILLTIFAQSTAASAAERVCTGDPIADTAAILCSAPSGPCSTSVVVLGGNLEVVAGGCTFDLGGRNLTVTKTFQMVGTEHLIFTNVHNATITATGKLKARGDFVHLNGEVTSGGLIRILVAGDLSIAGRLETTGNGAGSIELAAGGSVRLESGSVIQANGISTSAEDGDRLADGGDVSISSSSGDITLEGQIFSNGQNSGGGGDLDVRARRSIYINQALEFTGGAGGGGSVHLIAGDNVVISRPIDVDSRSGGGSGGSIVVEAGDETLVGEEVGGSILVDNTRLELRGSPPDGDGGDLDFLAQSSLQILGTNSALRANAGPNSSGSGGTISLRSGDSDLGTIGAHEGDIMTEGILLAAGGSDGGNGGTIEAVAARDLFLNASSDLTSRTRAGFLEVAAGRHVTIDAPIMARATVAAGAGGSITVRAGLGADGELRVLRDVDASGGANSGRRQSISLSGCALTIEGSVHVDAHAGTAPNGALGGGIVTLAARSSMELRGSSEYLANPGGRIVLVHPVSVSPLVSAAAAFNPPLRHEPDSSFPLPGCGGEQ